MTAQAWHTMFAGLPAHVQQVLGPEKNLLLLAEMLQAAGSEDTELVSHLSHGFPLLGAWGPTLWLVHPKNPKLLLILCLLMFFIMAHCQIVRCVYKTANLKTRFSCRSP